MTRTSIFQAIRGRETASATTTMSIAEPVYQPTYEEKLRLIGEHLDRNGMSAAKIMEVPGGFLVRVASETHPGDELLEFPDPTFPGLFQEAVALRDGVPDDQPLRLKSELIPTSYADVLRAIGDMLDASLTRSILISEGPGSIYVTGMRLENNSLRSTLAPFDQLLFPEDVDRMLDAAYRRRQSAP